MDVPAAQFKAECLKLMDEVEKTRQPIVITKHGRPVAQLAPVPQPLRALSCRENLTLIPRIAS